MASRASLALPLLLQSPPGQQSQVYADILALLESEGDDGAADAAEFEAKAHGVWRQHNVEQLITIDEPATSTAAGSASSGSASLVLSEHGSFSWKGQERFRDPRSKTSFIVDHHALKASDALAYKPNEHTEPLRAAIEAEVDRYILDRYETGIASVFVQSLPRPEPVSKAAEPKLAEKEAREDEEKPSEIEGREDDNLAKDGALKKDEEGEEKALEGEDSEMEKHEEEVETSPSLEKAATSQEKPEEKADEAMAEREEVEENDEEAAGPAKIFIHIIANKFKLNNYWSGRWRATYTFDPASSSSLESTLAVQIHYFEDGNVQLHGLRPASATLSLPTTAADPFDSKSTPEVAKAIASAIEKHEEAYQKALFATCSDLGERAFKALRRTLPLTKQKVDWDKVLNYKLGSELSR